MRQYFKKYLIGFIASSISFTSIAQINGTVTDSKTGKPLNGVEVFVNQTTTASQSDDAGQFTLENALTGFQELVLYKKGYSLYRSSMRVQSGHVYNLKLSLTASKKEKTTQLTEEEGAILRNQLANKTVDVSLITMVNEKELAMNVVEGKRMLGSPLIIQNDATGYRLKYYGMENPLTDISNAPISYEAFPALDVKQKILWEKIRKIYFKGSQRHWLITLIARQIKGQGYSLQNEMGNEVDTSSLLSTSSLPGYSKLTISQLLSVHFKKENGSLETSRVLTDGPVDVNFSGLLINSKALVIEGAMANIGLADRLPIDYQPIAGDVENVYAQTLERFYEKVYVDTDKPYYYPGEPIWFKGYINYQEPTWRDSLSKVMYVELINPKKELVLSKALKIDSGLFHNDFILPDTLKAGTYYLRAYTNLTRNFGDSILFVKPLPLLSISDKVEESQANMNEMESSLLSIIADKKKYKRREKIMLTLSLKDEGKPMAANLSISVTDASQVVPIEEPQTILNYYPLTGEKQKRTIELKYPVEYGVSHTGKFINDNGKPEKTTLTILQTKPRNMMMAASDEKGIFSITGLHFYDTATFSFKSDKAKTSAYGKVEMLPHESPKMEFKESNDNLTIQSTPSPQRLISNYEGPNDSKLLKTVEVRARRIPEEFQNDYRVKRPYGAPDYVLKAKDINTSYGNLMYAIQGRFPGLVVRRNDQGDWVVYTQRGALSSINNAREVLVTVNDIPMTASDGTGRTPDQVISSINPQTVESVEFTNRINVLYGSSSGFGVLSIYTKQGISEDALKVTPNFQAVKLTGYASSRNFRFPDYNDKETDAAKADLRSTIYWNPNVITNPGTGIATLSFFAADLPGKYRIVAEGITQTGAPVRCVYFVEVDSK